MTTDTLRVYRGQWGKITELPRDLPPREGMPEQAATLSHWFLHAPRAHPVWPNYLLFCCHLRDVEGQSRPANRRTPDASHEIDLIALNPEVCAWTAENVVQKMYAQRDRSAYLSPLNVSEQLRSATDAHATELTALLARAVVNGVVPIEPSDVRGGRERWASVIASTLEHIRTGGHPSQN
jgi:hypothetical protein